MPLITLTTDLGIKDYYLAALKGTIYVSCPDAIVVDISHHVNDFDTGEAAFLIKNAYKHFPAGTIHVIGVNDEVGVRKPFLAVECEGHFFVGIDNGIFSLILDSLPYRAYRIETTIVSPKFPLLEVLIKAACHLANGGKIEDLGKETDGFAQKIELMAFAEKDTIRGGVVYIDGYGNAITNITTRHFEQLGETRPFMIEFGTKYAIDHISNNYNDVPDGEIVALFNSSGNLEIAMNKGNASNLLGLKVRAVVRIEFQ
jgi:S-adenosyl-L-methionine hydrolase (adenosine-forming)